MKITLQHYDQKVSIQTAEEITADDFTDLMYRLGIMVGYHEKNIADACCELADTYYMHDKIEINSDAFLKQAYAETKHINQ